MKCVEMGNQRKGKKGLRTHHWVKDKTRCTQGKSSKTDKRTIKGKAGKISPAGKGVSNPKTRKDKYLHYR